MAIHLINRPLIDGERSRSLRKNRPYSGTASHVRLARMKWFCISSPGWQVVIVLTLLIFLGRDSMPVPGPDGRVVGELYACPVSTNPELAIVAITVFMQSFRQVPDGDEVIIVSHARVLKIRTDEPTQTFKWLPASPEAVNPASPCSYRLIA